MGVWLSWSLLHPRQIFSRQSEKPSKWSWQGPLPTRVAPSNSQEYPDGGAGAGVHAGGSQLPKWILHPRPMPRRIMLARSSMRPTLMADVVADVCRLINAANVMDLATGLFSVRHEEERAGDEEVAEDVVEEEEAAMLEVEAVKRNCLL